MFRLFSKFLYILDRIRVSDRAGVSGRGMDRLRISIKISTVSIECRRVAKGVLS